VKGWVVTGEVREILRGFMGVATVDWEFRIQNLEFRIRETYTGSGKQNGKQTSGDQLFDLQIIKSSPIIE
jgi:hypothetical protein